MAHAAVTIDRATMTIMADDDALTIDGRAAGTAGVRIATAGMTVTVASLAGGRGENGEAGCDGQESDEFFHDE